MIRHTVWYRYNAANFLQNSQKTPRNSHIRIQSLIHNLSQSLQRCMQCPVIFYRVITAPECRWEYPYVYTYMYTSTRSRNPIMFVGYSNMHSSPFIHPRLLGIINRISPPLVYLGMAEIGKLWPTTRLGKVSHDGGRPRISEGKSVSAFRLNSQLCIPPTKLMYNTL